MASTQFIRFTNILSSQPQPLPTPDPGEIVIPPEIPKTFTIFGLHGTPNPGGSDNLELTITDARRLRAKWWVALDPTEEELAAFGNAGINVITRLLLPDNNFNARLIESAIKKPNISNLLIQPFNEPNRDVENGGKVVSPEEHMRQAFIPAARAIISRGAIPLLTPLAQRAQDGGIDEGSYFARMLDVLKREAPDILSGNLAIALHNYIFEPGEDFWQRPRQLAEIVRTSLGFIPPIYITEAGLHQSLEKQFSEELLASETIRLLDSSIPNDLPVKAFCIWVYANFAQRPANHRSIIENEEVRAFELAAWRKGDGETPIFLAVENYASQQSPSPLP